jgi:hypothetical protein
MNNIESFWQLQGEHANSVGELPTEYLLKSRDDDNFVLIGIEPSTDAPYLKNKDFKGDNTHYKTPTINTDSFFNWLFTNLSIDDLVHLFSA